MKRLWSYWLITYAELTYWLVGRTPEGYHWAKADAWSRINDHRRAIKHLQSYLKYAESASVRWHLGLQLGCVEEWPRAAEEIGKAAAVLTNPVVRIAQAEAEMRAGNKLKVREIIATIDRDHPHLEGALKSARDEMSTECASEA